jgi:enoyl-CoA hydratase/carnithine racemase
MPEFVKTQQSGKRYDIVIAHPPVNAFSTVVYAELRDVFGEALERDDVHVVVLRGEGKGFSAGADIKEILGEVTTESRLTKFRIVDDMIDNLSKIPVPVIGAIHGFCVAAGMRVASHCDIRVAASDAIFGMPEVDRGLTAGSGSSLRRLNMPVGFVREMIFTGQHYSSEQMQQAGFVERVVAPEKLDEAVAELADVIASKERRSLTAIKGAANLEMQYLDAVEADRIVHDRSAEQEIAENSYAGIRTFLADHS